MDKLKNANRSDIMRALALARAQLRAGAISSYDPSTYMAKVVISPELVETGWLPIKAMGVGQQFGFYIGPNIGDQVLVAHLEDDFESGIVIGGLNDDGHQPPPVPSGEIWAVHGTQSLLKFLTNGDVALTSHNDLIVTAGNDLTVTAQNDINITTQDDVNLTVSSDVNVNIDGDAAITVTGQTRLNCDDINLGGTGGMPVARVGDTVVSGIITSGSAKVKAV